METDPVVKYEGLPIDTYFSIMSDIEFMQPYLEDSDIFNVESDKFKSFLIQSFCHLHPDFHYLSFLNKSDVDLEIIKAAGVLQIFPTNNMCKRNKLFDDMSKDEINKFWLKFFSLFKKQDEFTTESIFNTSSANEINFFKDMKSTVNYLNYQFPVVKKRKCVDDIINEELDNWKGIKDSGVTTPDESVCLYFDENQTKELDIDNLITDLQQVVNMCRSKNFNKHENKLEHLDFFTNFVNFTKNIFNYKKNLTIVSSNLWDKHNCKLNENIFENLDFIKRCNNNLKSLKSIIKTVN